MAVKKEVESKAKKTALVKEAEPKTIETKAIAKAGRRSSKQIKETEAKLAKEERKKVEAPKAEEAKTKVTPTKRSKLESRSKNYRKIADLINREEDYSLNKAIELAKKTSPVKFDASIELHVNLMVDPKQADQNVRGALVLPAGTGSKTIVAVISEDEASAKTAGADLFKNEDILKALEKGKTDFDILITTPKSMPALAKYARLLGPRGLMPNPKSGTVTNDISKAVKEAKAGRVEYRVDSSGIIHLAIGKVSFSESDVDKNIMAVVESLKQNKPQSVKGAYIRSAYLTTSMGPSIKLDLASVI